MTDQINKQFTLLQKWTGVVSAVLKVTFEAAMVPITLNESVIIGESTFSIEEIDPADLPLLKVGAVFYMTVGYEDRSSGRIRVQMIRFQRLPKDPIND